MILISIYIFVLGLIIGSFLNVCIYRIPRGESINFPPSHCPVCKKKIKFYDLIPVASYFILKGKCRFCGERISIKYPIVELLTGMLFLISFLKFGTDLEFIKNTVVLSTLLVVTFIDIEHLIIPDKVMVFSFICGIIFNIIGYNSNGYLLSYLYGFLVGGGVIFVIILLTNGMGGGDVKLMAVTGLFLGIKLTLLTLILSFIIGAGVGITLVILKRKKPKDYIPFGPWISIAAFLAMFFGHGIINWYISLL